jgi:DNA-binding transcriptional LysR family regulator
MNIQVRHIRAFIAVADERSFARAAEKLNVSQPALSQTIIQFEETPGFPVFERTTRSVTLTQFRRATAVEGTSAVKWPPILGPVA